jgi:phosphoribosyl-AMP cyclohydrolase
VSTSADSNDIEEGLSFQPKFDAAGLVTCVATDAGSGEVLMVAHMNDEALRKTIASGEAWYFSRSRKSLWRKGESSGQTQRVVEMRLDCDQDAIWIRVEQTGAACHTGRRSCFYRAVSAGEGEPKLSFVLFSAAIGIGVALVSAIIPYRKTARLDPIEVIQSA